MIEHRRGEALRDGSGDGVGTASERRRSIRPAPSADRGSGRSTAPATSTALS